MKIIVIVGKTSCGKDTVARYLREKYNVEPIVSYTTRPIRDCEVNGREHWFVTSGKMAELKQHPEELLAYTQFPKTGFEYCASTQYLNEDKVFSYILNPEGIEWLKEHRKDVDILEIGLEVPEDVIRERAISRGDDPEDVEERLDSERKQFDEYMQNNRDKVIDAGQSLGKVLSCVDKRIAEFIKVV